MLPGPLDQPAPAGRPTSAVSSSSDLLLGASGRARSRRCRRAIDGSSIWLDGVDDLPGAALLQDRGDQRLVLLGQLVRRARRRRGGVDHRCASTHSAAPGPVVPVPMRARATPRTTARGLAAGQPAHLLDDAQRADRGVSARRAGARAAPRGLLSPARTSLTRRRSAARTSVVGQVQRHDHARAARPRRRAAAPGGSRSHSSELQGLSHTHSSNGSPQMFPRLSVFAVSDRNGVIKAAKRRLPPPSPLRPHVLARPRRPQG